MPTLVYDLTLVIHDGAGTSLLQTFVQPTEVRAATAPAFATERAYLSVEYHGGGVSYSVFHAWLAADRVHLRIDEHCEWYAHSATTPTGGDATARSGFRDDDGSEFTVPIVETVTRGEARAALEHWLATGNRTPALRWE